MTITVFRNRLDRMLTKKAVLIIAIVVIPLMIGAAIFFSSQTIVKDKVAFITDDSLHIPSDPKIDVVQVDKKPPFSSLVLGQYNFLVEKKGSGYKVTTLKNETDQKRIEQFFKTGHLTESYRGDDQIRNDRGIGTNILGFIVMLVFMQGVAVTALYPEDRTIGAFRRMLASPLSVGKYLFAQSIFTFLCLYIPSYAAIVITSKLFGADIGYSFEMLAVLIGILTALATGFSICMTSIMKRNINLAASGISIVTCVLGGCFISFTSSNPILEAICTILPQKAFMTLIHGVEIGRSAMEYKGQIIYLFIWTIMLWLIGVFITKRRICKGIYE
ncbi:MDR ABC transporter permease [Bacillus glycinifermentans]|uniref:ABC transporter permease n=1 Tax=Bacillus glycinifermentans TaxID=1664069 RepID=A0A0J6EZU9_9BACI|nr:ABC transporter permease [Bacillus glycinifermentans]ATH94118.1 ABC transporter permease [Bacillus glycinifermentans]KMM63353.1 MDR ABC transporter permease [Bacillus glycinifermentans]KRT95548.1 ABC transporter permease [Bacillus glycinifermentans]MEC0484585.1 ABC transporter permease [Bacillus glycinifermentans]MEC0496526.1 ABC transporter permease [Bacillus glycinifermentans]